MKDRWTRIRWSRRRYMVDGVEYSTIAIAPWFVPLWIVHLWRRRGTLRAIREQRTLASARVVIR